MEFCKDRVFTAVNADELKPGDKVIVADTIMELRDFIEEKAGAMKCYAIIKEILPDNREKRFALDDNMRYSLAYLVERKENCTNCVKCENCVPPVVNLEAVKRYNCKFYERAEPKTEKKHYRPFRDTDELIKVWGSRCSEGKGYILNSLDMPHIWVRYKNLPKSKGMLVNGFENNIVYVMSTDRSMQELFDKFEFLDGSPCGVEE